MNIDVNLWTAWIAMLVGLLSGATVGLFFHRDDWMGGYAGWRRRLVRLGHISFLGTGLLNLAFSLTVARLELTGELPIASVAMVVGAVSMPTVCFLSAWHKPLRHLFFVPVVSLTVGVGGMVFGGLLG